MTPINHALWFLSDGIRFRFIAKTLGHSQPIAPKQVKQHNLLKGCQAAFLGSVGVEVKGLLPLTRQEGWPMLASTFFPWIPSRKWAFFAAGASTNG